METRKELVANKELLKLNNLAKKFLLIRGLEETKALVCKGMYFRMKEIAYDYLKTCPISELPLYLNHPYPIAQEIIQGRLSVL